MTTLNEIINNGFQAFNINTTVFDEYTCGMVKVHVAGDVVVNVFVMDVKINCAHDIDELMYICKRVNARA
ncbi:hypothetical protein ABDK00_010310 [Niabella insulamsoli]|uniref:hypothetical protein n=1 Tax=Niabella insulamsoli TaxID=3144874 RepID=UPI0031FCFC93